MYSFFIFFGNLMKQISTQIFAILLLAISPVITAMLIDYKSISGTALAVQGLSIAISLAAIALLAFACYQQKNLSDKQFHSIAEASPVGIFMTDADGKTIYTNERYNRITGLTLETAHGLGWQQAIHPDDRKRVMEEWGKVAQSHQLYKSEEFRFLHPDGTIRWVYGQAKAERDADDNILGFSGAVTEITKRKQTESNLRNSEEQLRQVIDLVPHIIFAKDQDGKLILANKALTDICGKSIDEIIGKTDVELGILENECKEFRIEDLRVLENNEKIEIPVGRITTHNNETRYMQTTKIPFKTGSDNHAAVLGIGVDITERLESEQAFQQSEERLRNLIDSVPLCIHEIDLDGKLVSMNKAGLNMVNAKAEKNIIGLKLIDFVALKNQPEISRLMAAAFQGAAAAFEFEGQGTFASRHFSSSFIPLRDESGKIYRLMGISEEITEKMHAENERKLLETQMLHSQKMESLGILAGGIAHDFNNLLTGILGNASLALLSLPDDTPVADCLKKIETTSLRAAELCRQMLAYSGKGRFIIKPVNLSELVEEMAQMLEVSISKKIIFKMELAENLPAVECDITQLRQIVMNLITNASEAIGDKSGVISISTGVTESDGQNLRKFWVADKAPKGLYVYFEVNDTGCGMSDAVKAKIFDPFYTTKFTGRGLGLAAVLGIVRGHHGTIHVGSTPKRGSTFKVMFPASKKSIPSPPLYKPPKEKLAATQTILIADDEETIRILAKQSLQSAGFKVLLAEDGRQAVDIYKKNGQEIDAVLLDLTMPELNGNEVFRELKKIDNEVCVILSSGYSEKEIEEQFAGENLAGIIQKPYRPQDLMTYMRETLSKHAAAANRIIQKK